MPGVSDGTPHGQPTAPAAWKPNKDEQSDLAALDVALNRMRQHIPMDPYIMTIEQQESSKYRHLTKVGQQQWLSHSPFNPEEEHESIQYQTFRYHEHGKEMYHLHSSRQLGERTAHASSAKPRGTGANTPTTGTKKKISLVRKKPNGDAVAAAQEAVKSGDASAKQPAVKGPVEKLKAETQEMLASVAEDTEEEQKMRKDKSPEQGDLKRKRNESEKESKQASHGAVPAQKKIKTEEPRTPAVKGALKQEARTQPKPKTTQENEAGLPPRLSPGMPPRLSPTVLPKLSPLREEDGSTSPKAAKTLPKVQEPKGDDEDKLPSRLSPTLPENITKSLKARAHLRSSSQSSNLSAPNSVTKDKNGMLTPIKRSDGGVTKHKSPVPRNGFRATSSSPAVRSDAEERGLPPATSAVRAKSPALSQEDEIAVGKALKRQPTAKPQDLTLLVKLKYKKARREDITRILKMRSIPDKRMSEPVVAEEPTPAKPVEKRNGERKPDLPAKTKGVAQKIGPVKKEKKVLVEEKCEKPSVAERRALPDDERHESPAKRFKKAEEPEKRKEPSTPAQKEVDSPMAPKSQQHITPSTRKELLSAAMKREQSQDSNATQTPPALTSTPSMNNSQQNGVSKPPSSQPSNKTPRQLAFETEQKRLEGLGRELKHSAQAHLATQLESDQRLAAVKSIESFLCYLMAFSCADEAAYAADPRQAPSYRYWRSLSGFYAFVKRNTEAFTLLSGMACSFGMVFSSRILEISTQVADGPPRETLIEFQALLQRSAAATDEKLDIDTLQTSFPRTWKERTKQLSLSERVDPTKLGGQYKLPIGLTTSPIRAARAGHAMLLEWMEKENIDYTLRLKL